MRQLVGKRQIDQRFLVDLIAKIVVVVAAEALRYTMMLIQHRRHAVEAESIEAIFIQVPADIR